MATFLLSALRSVTNIIFSNFICPHSKLERETWQDIACFQLITQYTNTKEIKVPNFCLFL
ncbi:MAG: hypothetical protein CMM45_05870 [Rhodospirillaceae bacterium]|nr:hypothetical protein [Rhodospirillaceae bacterium]